MGDLFQNKAQTRLLNQERKTAEGEKIDEMQENLRRATDELFRRFGRQGAMGGSGFSQPPILG